MAKQPAAFMSYVRFDDQHEGGKLTQFRERLSAEVRMQIGEEFYVFQDRNDISWGQQWQKRIEEGLDAATLLIPIMTPSFFRSKACRDEAVRFLDRERQLGRGDLILPVYYVSTPEIDDPERRVTDELAAVLVTREYADWRELRFEPFDSPLVRREIAKLAGRLRDTFWHATSATPAPARLPNVELTAQEASTESSPVLRHTQPAVMDEIKGRNADPDESGQMPVVLISSSEEGVPVANALQEILDREARVAIWTQGVFRESQYVLESLKTALERADFGVFLITVDDTAGRRVGRVLTPRDNILFELGIFVGGLGRERAFIITPRSVKLSFPLDPFGIDKLTYDPVYFRNHPLQAIGPVASRIRRAMQMFGLRQLGA